MKISIITVCYNSASTLETTILSVAGQTYNNIEYIIVDGNSDDDTLEIVSKYENKIDKFISEPDFGLYDAMNKGIKMATGDLIGILNSDDTFFSNTVVQEIVEFHQLNNIEASVGNIVQRKSNGKVVRFYSSKNWKPINLKSGKMPPHPSLFIKKELYEVLGSYHLDFKIAADYELIVRFFLKSNVKWKFSGITTTSMLIGGLSSSGISSYNLITKEICKALMINDIVFSTFQIKVRFLAKIMEYVKQSK